MSYATVADVREQFTGLASDEMVQAAIDYAEALVNAQTGQSWSAEGTRTVEVYDVRNEIVLLPEPFDTVTEVTVDTGVLHPSAYAVRPWGIELKYPYRTGGFRGNTVSVTATFGGTAPAIVREATVLLAVDRLNSLNSSTANTTGPLGELPSNVRSFSVEGLSMTLDDSGTASTGTSTGNVRADELLARVGPQVRIG